MATKPADAKQSARKPGKPKAPAEARVIADAGAMKLKDLVEQVALSSGVKKKEVKAVIEAALAAMGAALSSGRDLHLPPLGKARVGRQKGQAGAGDELLVVKIKRAAAQAKAASGSVTEDADSGKKDVSEGVAAAED